MLRIDKDGRGYLKDVIIGQEIPFSYNLMRNYRVLRVWRSNMQSDTRHDNNALANASEISIEYDRQKSCCKCLHGKAVELRARTEKAACFLVYFALSLGVVGFGLVMLGVYHSL